MSFRHLLSGEVELDGDADVAVEGGVAARRNERRGDLQVVVGLQGDVTAEFVLGRVFHVDRLVAGRGLGVVLLDTANEGVGLGKREVAPQVEVVAVCTLFPSLAREEAAQSGNLVAYPYGNVLGDGFDQLHRGDAQVEVAAVFIGEAARQVVFEGEVDAQQRRETLYYRYRRDVVGRRGGGKPRL